MALSRRTKEGLVVGGVVAGVAVAVVAADKLLPKAAATYMPLQPMRPRGVPTAGSDIPGIGVLGPVAAQPDTAAPSTSASAPTITNLQATPLSGGVTTLTWTGTLVSEWTQPDGTVADSIGYNLYLKRGGRWALLEPEVYPPVTIKGLSSGDVLGVAPIYSLPSGDTVGGTIQSVTVG